MSGQVEIGVDVGGTFTDVVARDTAGRIQYFKVPTSRGDESTAVLDAIDRLIRDWEVEPAEISLFAHGTTVATNAVLERQGAEVALITTKGFRDVLAIGRQMRRQMYDAIVKPETPAFLAPRYRRREVSERVSSEGEVLTPLDEGELIHIIDDLRAEAVQAISVSFLFSFINPHHELRAKKLIKERFPEVAVSLSHEVNPVFREYERTVATCFDAYLKPTIDAYLAQLEDGLRKRGFKGQLQIMQSRGGLMASHIAREQPVRLFLSGPAAGVAGAQANAEISGFKDIITLDVGGTSSDIAVIRDGRALVRSEASIDNYPVRVATVDVNSIGAGGGSIAWIDAGGGIRVGPRSAGSRPGPACFCKGGTEPTVTDASLVLGYLSSDCFADGAITLDLARAEEAIYEKIAKPLGLGLQDAALGIHRIANTQMSEGIRAVTTSRGLDPRLFALMPFGGGGAIHAAALARDLHIRHVIVPRLPGVLSAAGLLSSAVEHEAICALNRDMDGLSPEDIKTTLATLDRQCRDLMEREKLANKNVDVHFGADICYIGQSYWLDVPLDVDEPDMFSRAYEAFLTKHHTVYGHSERVPARIVNLRCIHRSIEREPIGSERYVSKSGAHELKPRNVLLARDEGPVLARVYRRERLPVGLKARGPAIIEQPDTTVVVDGDCDFTVQPSGMLIVSRNDLVGTDR